MDTDSLDGLQAHAPLSRQRLDAELDRLAEDLFAPWFADAGDGSEFIGEMAMFEFADRLLARLPEWAGAPDREYVAQRIQALRLTVPLLRVGYRLGEAPVEGRVFDPVAIARACAGPGRDAGARAA